MQVSGVLFAQKAAFILAFSCSKIAVNVYSYALYELEK